MRRFQRTVEIRRRDSSETVDAAHAEFSVEDEGWRASLTPAVEGTFRGEWLLWAQADLYLPSDDVTCHVVWSDISITPDRLREPVSVQGSGPPPSVQ
jgi:hypothetical protein